MNVRNHFNRRKPKFPTVLELMICDTLLDQNVIMHVLFENVPKIPFILPRFCQKQKQNGASWCNYEVFSDSAALNIDLTKIQELFGLTADCACTEQIHKFQI